MGDKGIEKQQRKRLRKDRHKRIQRQGKGEKTDRPIQSVIG